MKKELFEELERYWYNEGYIPCHDEMFQGVVKIINKHYPNSKMTRK